MRKKTFILLLFILVMPLVSAQNEDQFLPSELKQLTAVTEPITLRKGFFRIGTKWDYTGIKKYFDKSSKRYYHAGSTIGRSQIFNFSFQYGINDRFQLNLTLPYNMNKVENVIYFDDPAFRSIQLENYSILQTNYDEKGFGLGDLSAGIFTQLIKESEKFPSIALRTTVGIPSGRKDVIFSDNDSLGFKSANGSGEYSLMVDIHAKKIMYPYSFGFYANFDFGFGGTKIFVPGEDPMVFKSGPAILISGNVNFHLNDWICITNDLSYRQIGSQEIQGIDQNNSRWLVDYTPNIHFQVKQLRLVQGVSIPLIGGYLTSADPTFSLIVQYIF